MNQESSVYSVSQITEQVKQLFDLHPLLPNVSVQGEISNFKLYPSGHMYFTLKDEASKLKMVMFAGANRRLTFVPKDGMQVIARGAINVYERDGQYQMTVNHLQQAGIGQLFIQLEQLKQKLMAEGLFDQRYKQALPAFPRTIGVVTSAAGAVIRDIITTVRRRYPLANILLFPSQVQGDEAPSTIVDAIEKLNRANAADVLIVGRGGGSLEELWAFNDERVARAIFASRIPIISAVGHETDHTIADYVADFRAPTPTAAAEMVVPDQKVLAQRVSEWRHRMTRALIQRAGRARDRLSALQRSPMLLHPMQQIHTRMQQLDHLTLRLRAATEHIVGARREHLRTATSVLDSLSPLKVMNRGYSLVYDEDNQHLLQSVNQTATGKTLQVRLVDGRLICKVEQIKQHLDNREDGSDE
jgi:exodeoxyribonuclease VII large subunit